MTDSGLQSESQGDLERARREGHRKVNNVGKAKLLLTILVIIMMSGEV